VRCRELASANSSRGELAGGGLHDFGASGEKLIAVVHGKHVVFVAGAVFVDRIASAALGL
jgi:hypothetical protein